MKKISKQQEEQILTILRFWSEAKLTWDHLRVRIETHGVSDDSWAWSRQALSARPRIKAAFKMAKQRVREQPNSKQPVTKFATQIEQLRMRLAEVEHMYDELLLRHSRLVFNASLLEGGVELLDAPLPDNTKSQRG